VYKFWSFLFGAVNLAALGLFVVAPFYGWWLPKDVSAPGFGSDVDWLYYLILWTTGFFFVLTEALLVYYMWKYAHEAQPAETKPTYIHGNHKLEWSWTIVTALILLVVAFTQVRAWEHIKYQSHFPAPDQFIEVSARQFEWRMRYPGNKYSTELVSSYKTKPDMARTWDHQARLDDVQVVNDLHTYAGAKVRVYLKTRDVLHSFFLPNLRLKQDAVPGKTIPVWFQTNEKDFNCEYDDSRKDWVTKENWPLAGAELCGWGHYKMQGQMFVHKDRADYERWVESQYKKQTQRQAD